MEKIQLGKHIITLSLLDYGLRREIVFFLMKVALMDFIPILLVMVSHLDLHQKIGDTYQLGQMRTVRFLFHVLDLDTTMKE